jgi:hypothetical protein
MICGVRAKRKAVAVGVDKGLLEVVWCVALRRKSLVFCNEACVLILFMLIVEQEIVRWRNPDR